MTVPSRKLFVEEIEKLGVGEGTYVVIYDGSMNVWAADESCLLVY